MIGLGANLGDRLANLRAAAGEIARKCHVERGSRVYETAPVGGPTQPAFLNAAMLVTIAPDDRAPIALLDALLAIEARLGRTRGERWGPRVIDLDVLWIEGVVVDSPRLIVPHPRLRQRAFALAPMLEIAAGARDPKTGERYALPEGDVRDTWVGLIAQCADDAAPR
ncbi:MAG: 2-amino-4-hydroxy-6-hydroxymethyldihydropteridine diphosphokinase [Polyangiaceae bacterium]